MGDRSFLFGFAAALAISACAFAGVLRLAAGIIPNSGTGWTASIVEERIAIGGRAPTGKRIVVLAGSNGLFGVSAQQLAQATGIESVNLSSHAALNWDFLAYTNLRNVHRGDTLLLPLEIAYYARPAGALNTLTVEVAEITASGYFGKLSPSSKVEYLRLLSWKFLQQQLQLRLSGSRPVLTRGYVAYPTQSSGDIDTTDATQNLAKVEQSAMEFSVPDEIDPSARAHICHDIRSLRRRGVEVIGAPPNVYVREDMRDRYRRFLSGVRSLFEQCGGAFLSLDNYGERPIEDMLDTEYHLLPGARSQRTHELAVALCRLRSCPRSPDS